MPKLPIEVILMSGYAILLSLIAWILEFAGGHAHKRSTKVSVIGFTYHAERDVWQCPQNQHLFPVFSDPVKGKVIYRGNGATCNACRSKAACTDSNNGREITREDTGDLQFGMQRFHRAVSVTLLLLASAILAVESFRTDLQSLRAGLVFMVVLFSVVIFRMIKALSRTTSLRGGDHGPLGHGR
jgi:hypothetical protein